MISVKEGLLFTYTYMIVSVPRRLSWILIQNSNTYAVKFKSIVIVVWVGYAFIGLLIFLTRAV